MSVEIYKDDDSKLIVIDSDFKYITIRYDQALDVSKLLERVANNPPSSKRVVALCGPTPIDIVR